MIRTADVFRLAPESQQTLHAALICILPSDDGPGAEETLAFDYVERVLTEVVDGERRRHFLEGLHLLDDVARERHGLPFRLCAREKQDDVLTHVLGIPHRLTQQFVASLIHVALQGFLCAPRHGGNHGGQGWAYLSLPETAEAARP